MMVSVEVYLRRGHRQLRQWAEEPGVRAVLRVLGYSGAGFVLSAAGLGGVPQPLAMGLCCALTGWRSLAAGLGSMGGYRLFWQEAGLQGMVWAVLGCILALLLGKLKLSRDMPLLIPGIAAFQVAAMGLVFQILWLDDTTFDIYTLRVALAALSTLLFTRLLLRRDALSHWLCQGVFVLALARVAPLGWLSMGYAACGFFGAGRTFPTAVMAGMGLDLARITPIPMTAVLCTAYFLRQLPLRSRWLRYAGVGIAYLGVMALWGSWDVRPLPGLLLGTALGEAFPTPGRIPRQGSTGHAQVRLELTAGILAQTQQLLLETQTPPVDEEALLEKVRVHACSGCSSRQLCREQYRLTALHLRQPMDFQCRKPGRIRGELRRSRELLYALRRDRARQQEYRWALVQQYRFLSEYIRGLADQLSRREPRGNPRYRIRVSARSRKKELSNGDRCMAFPGGGCRYYVVLCDGMGTGLGAAREGQTAAELLKQLLVSGFPAEHALRTINSILVLRGQAGAVTLDLAEISLETGKAVLHKWGAAPSYLITRRGMERLGSTTLPPGLSLREGQEDALHLSLCRGESLVLISDGAAPEPGAGGQLLSADMDTGELAEEFLAHRGEPEDDATAVVLRLLPLGQGNI